MSNIFPPKSLGTGTKDYIFMHYNLSSPFFSYILIIHYNFIFFPLTFAELGTRLLFSFATTTRQRNRDKKKFENIKASASGWSSHNEYSNGAITNTFVA